jgi:hypothetical protein
MIKTFFYAWGALPWRKPLAMTAGFSTLCLVCLSFAFNRDIQPNACNLLIWIDTVIFSWAYGTSAAEAIQNAKK